MQNTIAVAMSGGVDSSAAAWLLQQEGYEAAGVTMRLFRPEDLAPGCQGGCHALEDLEDARRVAEQLGIPHYTLDLSQRFAQAVMDPFAGAYEAGRTPNPCVVCNRTIKFGALLQEVRNLGYSLLATGHYAQVEQDAASGRFLLRQALHPEKDQSYVLWSLTQEQLAQVRLPLGGLSKDEIRSIAQEQGLISARKRDSQDICFVPNGDYAAFIQHRTGKAYPPGPFLDREEHVLGTHQGIIRYTVGQRRGLGVSSSQGRLYVQEVRAQDNAVVLGDNASLFHKTLTARELNLIPVERLDQPIRVRAKVRYRMAPQPATLEQTGPDSALVTFDQPQRAITPGQSVVFYDGALVVGGGVIDGTGQAGSRSTPHETYDIIKEPMPYESKKA